MGLDSVKHVLIILSGKGGVGKSSVTTQLALALSLQGNTVGVLDIDLTGPSLPRFFGIEKQKVTQATGGLVPVTVHESRLSSEPGEVSTDHTHKYGQLSCMSLGFILSDRSQAVIWRGPKKTAMVRQFLTSTLWPDNLDFLLIDTPPGTSDEHISLAESLLKETAPNPAQLAGAVVVTTPQAISVSDVKKELNFCKKVNIRVLGIVENMAGFVCPHCSHCTDVFSKGGGEATAAEFGVPFLGSVPLDPAFVALIEEGTLPTYPKGTVVNGKHLFEHLQPEVGEGSPVESSDLLVEKYTRCSLFPLFDSVATRLTTDIKGSTG